MWLSAGGINGMNEWCRGSKSLLTLLVFRRLFGASVKPVKFDNGRSFNNCIDEVWCVRPNANGQLTADYRGSSNVCDGFHQSLISGIWDNAYDFFHEHKSLDWGPAVVWLFVSAAGDVKCGRLLRLRPAQLADRHSPCHTAAANHVFQLYSQMGELQTIQLDVSYVNYIMLQSCTKIWNNPDRD